MNPKFRSTKLVGLAIRVWVTLPVLLPSANFNFRQPDAIDSAAFNRLLWLGVMGDKPYPTQRSRQSDDEADTR